MRDQLARKRRFADHRRPMNAGRIVRGIAAWTALLAVSCGATAKDAGTPPPGPARSAAPRAAASAAPAPTGQRQSFASLGAALPPAPGPRVFVMVYVDLSKSHGSPLLDAAGAAVRAGDHATAKQELAAALKKLDPVADFVPWLIAHVLWGRTCKATGDQACAEREHALVRAAWSDPAAAEQKAEGNEPDRLVRNQAVGRAVTAVGESLYFFADKHRRETVEPIKIPEYKGDGSQKDMARYYGSDLMPWMKTKFAAMNAAEAEYNKVLAMAPGPAPLWSIEAAAAVARMWDVFVKEILKAPMPADFKKRGNEDLARDWQQVLVVTGYPAVKHVRNGYRVCRDFAAKAPGYDEIAKECVDWLAKNPEPETPPQPPEWAKAFLSPAVLKAMGADTK
jgi:hypothetical protein